MPKSAKAKLTEYEKCLNKFSTKKEERNSRSNAAEELITTLESKFAELKAKLFKNTTFTFSPMNEISNLEDLFGKLTIKVSYF